MRRLLFLVTLFVVVLAAPAAAQSPCTKTWSGPATGGLWNAGGNWTPAGAPGSTDVVCIGPGTDTTANATSTVAELRSEGIVRVTTALTLTSPTELSVVEDLRLGAGLAGAGDIDVDTLTWTSGTMAGTGTTTVREQHTISGGSVGDGRTLVTEGTGTWTGSPAGSGSALWINRADITFGPGDLNSTLVGGVRPLFVNEADGSVTRTNSGGNFDIEWRLENDGVLARDDNAAVGNLWMDHGAPGISTGAFTRVQLNGAGTRLGEGAQLDGSTIRDQVELNGGTYPINNGGLAAGTVTGPGTVVLSGHFEAYYGRLGTPGTIVILTEGSDMLWTASYGMYASRFENAGTVTIEATGANEVQTWGNRTVWENTGTVILKSGRYRNAPANTSVIDESTTFYNRGLIVKQSTSNFTFDPLLVNDGVVDIQQGRITAPRYDQTPDGTLRFGIGGTGAASTYGVLTSSRFNYGGRLEAVLTGGFTPAAGNRFDVISSPTASRSGAFSSSSLAGLTLDESQPAAIGLVQSALRPSSAAELLSGPGVTEKDLAASAEGTPTLDLSANRAVRAAAAHRAAALARHQRALRRARRAAGLRQTRTG